MKKINLIKRIEKWYEIFFENINWNIKRRKENFIDIKYWGKKREKIINLIYIINRDLFKLILQKRRLEKWIYIVQKYIYFKFI